MAGGWCRIACGREELCLRRTLVGGQSFRWKEEGEYGMWSGVVGRRAFLLRQTDSHLLFRTIGRDRQDAEAPEAALRAYFRLDDDLQSLYSEWCKKDVLFGKLTSSVKGVRLLKQDPLETTLSFLCSSNNNVKRIWGMVEKLCSLYGTSLGQSPSGRDLCSCPSLSSLAKEEVEGQLRQAGFGYRARFVRETALTIQKMGGEEWLRGLRNPTVATEEARDQLLKLPGVGPKVADCILLMGLEHLEVVPVDTHVRQLAKRWHLPSLPISKSVTATIYKEISQFYSTLYGVHAGWAQAMLFASELKNLPESEVAAKVTKRKRKVSDDVD